MYILGLILTEFGTIELFLKAEFVPVHCKCMEKTVRVIFPVIDNMLKDHRYPYGIFMDLLDWVLVLLPV